MKKIFPYVLICSLLFACKPDKKLLLERTWRAKFLNNPQMNEILTNGQKFIDTVGTHTNAETNKDLYGTTNLDSLKKALQVQMDSVVAMQQRAVEETVFTFRKDGIAVIKFNGSEDSTKWYFDENGAIILDENKQKGSGDKIKMEIVSISDTALQLNFQENGVNSVVTFHPDKK